MCPCCWRVFVALSQVLSHSMLFLHAQRVSIDHCIVMHYDAMSVIYVQIYMNYFIDHSFIIKFAVIHT